MATIHVVLSRADPKISAKTPAISSQTIVGDGTSTISCPTDDGGYWWTLTAISGNAYIGEGATPQASTDPRDYVPQGAALDIKASPGGKIAIVGA